MLMLLEGLQAHYHWWDFSHNQNMKSFSPLVGQDMGLENKIIFLPNKIPKLLCTQRLSQSQEQFYRENR